MLQKVCPVCDQVMKHAHYCSGCRSWVKEPVTIDVTYYLNERHPEKETHCSYHNAEPALEKKTSRKQKPKVWESQNRQTPQTKSSSKQRPANTAWSQPKTQETRKTALNSEQKKPIVKKTNPIISLIVLYLVVIVIAWIMKLLSGLGSLVWGILDLISMR